MKLNKGLFSNNFYICIVMYLFKQYDLWSKFLSNSSHYCLYSKSFFKNMSNCFIYNGVIWIGVFCCILTIFLLTFISKKSKIYV